MIRLRPFNILRVTMISSKTLDILKYNDRIIFVPLIECFTVLLDIYCLSRTDFDKLFCIDLWEYLGNSFSLSQFLCPGLILMIHVVVNLLVNQYLNHVEHLGGTSLLQVRFYVLRDVWAIQRWLWD